jgi:hypothetical protein
MAEYGETLAALGGALSSRRAGNHLEGKLGGGRGESDGAVRAVGRHQQSPGGLSDVVVATTASLRRLLQLGLALPPPADHDRHDSA